MKAPVNRILPLSLVDGPGNRSVVFLQGCNFHCAYCHNPETIQLCRHCGACLPHCPAGALREEAGAVRWLPELCQDCGECLRQCPHFASPKTREMTPAEVMEPLRENRAFIRGITLSGGECTLHRNFAAELFRLAKADGLTTLLDSNGSLPLAADRELMACCDGVMLDVKAYSPVFHHQLTGQGNATVLENAKALAEMGKLAELRTVILPESPHNAETIRGLGGLLGGHACRVPYKLLRFRPQGVKGEAAGWKTPGDSEMEALRNTALNSGFKTVFIL